MNMIMSLMLAAVAVLPPESFERGDDGVWVCDLAKLGVEPEAGEYASGGWTKAPVYPELYYGNVPMTLAREPDEGWFTFKGPDNVVVTNLPAAGYSLAGYWTQDWAFETLRVASVEDGKARFADRHAFGIGQQSWGSPVRRYYAVNHRDFLDTPGEWYLDRATKKLAFIPPAEGLSAAPLRLAWGGESVLKLVGRTNEVIRGETVAFGGAAGVELVACTNVTLADCVVECVAGPGIVVRGDCRNVTISNCTIRTVGAEGVILSGGDRRTLADGWNRVFDCDIHDFALRKRVYAPGVSMSGCGNCIVRSRIFNAPHSAILYSGNDHLIANNDIHDVIRETGDAGAIYTGRDWTSQGNLVIENFIHDLGQSVRNGSDHDVFTMGVYLDDCDSGDTVIGNRFSHAGCAVMVGGGRDNRIAGNEIEDCDVGVHLDSRGVTWTQHWNNPSDPGWNLIGKAEALGYREEPWRKRYPHLATIMEDEPRLPKYTRVDGNRIVRTRIPYQFDTRPAVEAHLATFFDEGTGLYYGRGTNTTEDCAILTGLALSDAVDRRDAKRAAACARGLLSLATAAGVPGYVCRGIARDGKTVDRGSSRDQVTHFVHGLFRYHESGLADAETKAKVAAGIASVADRMLANVTEANGWNALTPEGKADSKGVLKMWNVRPHEAARLPEVYAAAWKVTGEEKYRLAYERYADAAIEQSWGISQLTPQQREWTMPGYAYLQMNASLEVMRLADPARAERIEAVMKEVAKLAAERFVAGEGDDGEWLSAAGDLAFAVMMTSKIEKPEVVMGWETALRFERLFEECRLGINGQLPLWEASSPRILSFRNAVNRR